MHAIAFKIKKTPAKAEGFSFRKKNHQKSLFERDTNRSNKKREQNFLRQVGKD